MFRTKEATQHPADGGRDAAASREEPRELGLADDRPSRGKAGEPSASKIQGTTALVSLSLPKAQEHRQEAAPRTAGKDGTEEAPFCPIRAFAAELAGCRQEISSIAGMVEEIAEQKAALEHLAERHRALAERFHEREVLNVVFGALIGLNDRTCQTRERLSRELRSAGAAGRPHWASRLRALCEEKEADELVVNQLLSQFGVQRFEDPSCTFVPTTQHCVQRVPTTDATRHGEIARRLAIGYQRGEIVIRPEQVSVYVANARVSQNQKEGE